MRNHITFMEKIVIEKDGEKYKVTITNEYGTTVSIRVSGALVEHLDTDVQDGMLEALLSGDTESVEIYRKEE